MPQSKEYSQREQIIDRYLSTGNTYVGEELMRLVNEELRSRGMKEIASRSTFAADINEINYKFYDQYHCDVIRRERRGRQFFYSYALSGFCIYNRELTEEELATLHHLVTMLRRFKGMPHFGWLETLEERFDQAVLRNRKAVVAFDDSYNESAMKPFNPLLQAIERHQAVAIEYRRFFDKDATQCIVSPYFLKQYGLRWYLLGAFHDSPTIYTFALDRMLSVTPMPDAPYDVTAVDFDHYFDDIVGVSQYKAPIIHVEIWVSARELPYLLSKPLHKSQRLLSQDDNGGMIAIDVKWNFELEATILSYGEHLEVMEPVSLRLHLKSRIRQLLDIYNTPEPGL